jgi:predicted short-subunit dehydrogenase-like oxidoreductase (DUF2520 family)
MFQIETQKMPESILIIGKSKVGQSLAKAIRTSKNYRLAAIIPARANSYPVFNADIIIIAAKDDKIAEVAQKVISSVKRQPKIIVHLAGSQPATILPERRRLMRLTLHPLQTFPKADSALLQEIYWMASSEDAAAIRWAKKFTSEFAPKGLIVLPGDALPLYHAMTVFSSNFITLLFSVIEEISASLGQDAKKIKTALRPLAEKSLLNALSQPAKSVLSGPISRKDTETIRKHQNALKSLDPKLRKIYDAFVEFGME